MLRICGSHKHAIKDSSLLELILYRRLCTEVAKYLRIIFGVNHEVRPLF